MNVHKDVRRNDDGASLAGTTAYDAFLQENPQVQYVDCVFVDLCGAVRGKRIGRGDIERVFAAGLQIPYTIYFLDARGDMVEGLGRGVFDGNPEGMAWPVPGTLTRVNWSQRPHGQVLMTLCDAQGRPYFGEPRNVLARVVKRFADLDLVPSAGFEIEFHFVDRDRTKNGVPRPPADDDHETAHEETLNAIVEAAAAQGLPPVTATPQTAPGQFKLRLNRTSDAVRAGDHAVFLRQIARAVARKQGRDATFMAKPYLGQPGNAMHVEAAITRGSGKDVFDDREPDGSGMLRSAVGGLQAVMAESMALFAPNANAFRRFAADTTLARNKRWGYENRLTILGAPGTGKARYIEHRLPAADANPYLVLAAIFAGIHHGIVAGIDPGSPFEGDAATFVDQTIPFNADGALVALENGSILREYLGPSYVDLYCATKRAELERFRNHIPAHEYDWYL